MVITSYMVVIIKVRLVSAENTAQQEGHWLVALAGQRLIRGASAKTIGYAWRARVEGHHLGLHSQSFAALPRNYRWPCHKPQEAVHAYTSPNL